MKKRQVFWIVACSLFIYCNCRGSQSQNCRLLDTDSVQQLLIKPPYLASYSDSVITYVVARLSIPSHGIYLWAELYLPSRTGTYPLLILTHGGFNEFDLIMSAPLYYAPRLAHSGIAALVYHKRGTGESGGVYALATLDDFINDIGSIACFLSQHPNIDSTRIGVLGGSAGGINGAIAAARFPIIRWVVSTSAPIVPDEELRNYNIENSLRFRGFPDSLVQVAMPYWRRHHALWAQNDTNGLKLFAAEIIELRKQYDPLLLPSKYEEVFNDTSLIPFRPFFNSAGRKDGFSDIKNLESRWLCIFGEKDSILPVQSSIENIQAFMSANGNEEHTIVVLPNADHNFYDAEQDRYIPVIRIILNWLKTNGFF